MDEAMALTARYDLVELLDTVNGAMTESLVAVSPEAPVSVALAILEEHGVCGVPVVLGGRLVGIVTIADLVDRRTSAQHTSPFLRPHHEGRDWRVADVMAEPWWHHRGNRSSRPSSGMDDARVDRLPVVDPGGRPIGVLARENVVCAVARAARHGGAGGTERRPLLLPD
jgi:CBS domain-containing protein